MPINKEHVIDELRALNVHFAEGTRRLLQLSLQVQNMVEEVPPLRGEFTSQELMSAHALASRAGGNGQGVAAIEASMQKQGMQLPAVDHLAQHPAVVAAEAASQTQKAVFIPQMNTQEVVDSVKSSLSVHESLERAKAVFKTALAEAGLPEHLATMADSITPQIIEAHRAAKGGHPEMPSEFIQPSEAELAEQADKDTLSTFIGRGSIFMDALSADVMSGARGIIKPGVFELKRYSDDARWVEENSLRHWKTGFYTDRDSKGMQFLVNSDQCAVLIESLPSETSPVRVMFYGTKAGWKQIQEFMASEQKLIFAKVQDALTSIGKKKTDA